MFAYLSRIRGMVFSLGMAGGGLNVGERKTCPELRFCQDQQICYRFNRFQCFRTNCIFYHVCKRCWLVDEISKNHACNDIAQCSNMTESYRVSLEKDGGGVAPPGYYSNQEETNDRANAMERPAGSDGRSESRREDRSESRTEDRSESRREDRSESRDEDRSESRRVYRSQSRSEDRPQSRGEDRPQSRGEDRPQSRGEDRPQSRGEDRPQSRGEDRMLSPSHRVEQEHERENPRGEAEGAKYRGILDEMQRLRQENLQLKQQLARKETVDIENKEKFRNLEEMKIQVELDNEELRQKIREYQTRDEESIANSKVRVVHAPVMQPYSRLKLVTNLPSGFDSRRYQSNQPGISRDHLPNLGNIEVPPLFSNNLLNSKGDHVTSRGLENPSAAIFQGPSTGSGASHGQKEDIFNLYGNESTSPTGWLTEEEQEAIDWKR